MEYLTCPWDAPSFLIFSDNIPSLLYYSHLPGMIISLILGLIVFKKNNKSKEAFGLLMMSALFFIWGFLDLILWATNNPNFVVFWWSIVILVEPFIFIAAWYLIKVFVNKTYPSFKEFLIIGILLLPLLITLPTKLNISGIYLLDCVAIEGIMAIQYVYILETIFSLWITLFIIKKIKETPKENKTRRRKILFMGIGIISFLLGLLYGNIIGSLTLNWEVAQFGVFGMSIFIIFISYLIVKFKTFNIKLIGTQALVIAVWVLVSSLLFVNSISKIKIIVLLTLLALIPIGIFLIRSVKREHEQRERIERLAIDLKKTNDRLKELDRQKSEFVSLASHQLRGPLSAINGFVSLILENSYGEISDEVRGALEKVSQSSKDLGTLAGDYLDVTRIELGKMKYENEVFDLSELARESAEELRPAIENSQLKLNIEIDNKIKYLVEADRGKIKQVILNFLDNALKYTNKGSITLSMKKEDSKILIAIKDTGTGIPEKVLPRLFNKFTRAPKAHEQNIKGTGLGLFVAKKIIDAHNGRVWAESEGEGKGSTFFIEVPAK